MGATLRIKDTLDACVKVRAVFSNRKYSEPPVMPANNMSPSSLIDAANSRLWLSSTKGTYASAKRQKKILEGLNPWFIKTLVEMNVIPQMTMVTMAIT